LVLTAFTTLSLHDALPIFNNSRFSLFNSINSSAFNLSAPNLKLLPLDSEYSAIPDKKYPKPLRLLPRDDSIFVLDQKERPPFFHRLNSLSANAIKSDKSTLH